MEELLDEIELNDQPPCFPLLLELRRTEGKLKVCSCNDDRKRENDGGKFVWALTLEGRALAGLGLPFECLNA